MKHVGNENWPLNLSKLQNRFSQTIMLGQACIAVAFEYIVKVSNTGIWN